MRTIGILGGMGPRAGVDLARRIVTLAAVDATCDQDHPPIVLLSDPTIAPRNHPDAGAGIVAGVRRLEAAGADVWALACNGAHRWWIDADRATCIPGVSLVGATADQLADNGVGSALVLCTSWTREADVWTDALRSRGVTPLYLDRYGQAAIDRTVAGVKAGHDVLDPAIRAGVTRHLVDTVVNGCTELPFVLPEFINPAEVLAHRLYEAAREGDQP